MSSGTQLDWTGIDVDPSGPDSSPSKSSTGFGSAGAGSDGRAGAYLTDEEILGIEPLGTVTGARRDVVTGDTGGTKSARNLSSADDRGTGATQRDPSSPDGAGTPRNDDAQFNSTGQPNPAAMPSWMQTLAGDPKHGPEARQLWEEHQAFRAAFSSPAEAREIKAMFPGGAQEAQSLKQASQSVDKIDAAIFSGDTRAQSEVVAELARANPAAFRSLFAEAAKVLAGLGQTFQPDMQGAANHNARLTDREARVADRESQVAGRPAAVTSQGSAQFDPVAYSNFERSTNDAVARDVRSTIGDTLSRVLPEGVAEGAARRIGDDIFNEVHRALAADRTLSEQVGEALRAPLGTGQGWKFGAAEQRQVASLLAGRAKQLVPSVARRVIGEWTSSVLVTARSKAARQQAAASRVDIAAPGGSLDSMPLRAMSQREVNYASMSDDDILGM